MKNVMILSGAGLSAPSGLKTFRDHDGLWDNHNVMEVCSATAFRKNPQKIFDFYDTRRAELAKVKPNHAHEMIAKLKEKYTKNLFIITQNVDDLLERAGCAEVTHLHGFLPELVCMDCGSIFDIGYESQRGKICPKCKSLNLRHNIVMFEEQAPMYSVLYELLKQTSLFVCIGTSGAVLPVGHYARMCEKSILNNLEKDEKLEAYFDKCYYQSAELAIDQIAKDIEDFLRAA
ncbi:NAD-dependent deacetylase [Campylobacter sp. MIT 99-7217]|uniref:SIR2 family NAD-dependent protein deacylase n=1 Tax=Campylobacter sp. MIT 99-7217 TaxID=535091 RepID=UPI00115BECF3|nr:NAD-dependent deacetylase [Campylobacter sp. MIT 99-7217]TQR33108.1 NAD-dependent deacetylase [Campylobacter sp. MIT 99-7217]